MGRAEIEGRREQYNALIERARDAERQSQFSLVVALAVESLPFLDDMLKLAKMADTESRQAVAGVSLVLQYAPPLLDVSALELLQRTLASCRRRMRQSRFDFSIAVDRARSNLWLAHAILDHLERHRKCDYGTLNEKFQCNDLDWRPIVKIWESMQLVRCFVAGGNGFVTLGAWAESLTRVKCPQCGCVASLERTTVFAATECRRCQHQVIFIQVSDVDHRKG